MVAEDAVSGPLLPAVMVRFTGWLTTAWLPTWTPTDRSTYLGWKAVVTVLQVLLARCRSSSLPEMLAAIEMFPAPVDVKLIEKVDPGKPMGRESIVQVALVAVSEQAGGAVLIPNGEMLVNVAGPVKLKVTRVPVAGKGPALDAEKNALAPPPTNTEPSAEPPIERSALSAVRAAICCESVCTT